MESPVAEATRPRPVMDRLRFSPPTGAPRNTGSANVGRFTDKESAQLAAQGKAVVVLESPTRGVVYTYDPQSSAWIGFPVDVTAANLTAPMVVMPPRCVPRREARRSSTGRRSPVRRARSAASTSPPDSSPSSARSRATRKAVA